MKKKIIKIFEIIKLNIGLIFLKFFAIAGFLYSTLSIVLSFISWEEMKITYIGLKIMILVTILMTSLIISFLHSIFFKKSKSIWKKGNNQVIACYGDVLKLGFKNKRHERIVVIPVDDFFDTIVDPVNASIKNPLVEELSIHGGWAKRFCEEYKMNSDELYALIKQNLDLREYEGKVYTKEGRSRGALISYPIGTVAEVDSPKNPTKYFLLVISKFDKNNNAQSNKEIIVEAVESLVKYYDKYGQDLPIYIPLMGTKKSRADISHEQSLRLIKSCVLNQNKIIGDYKIVVYNGDRDKVSIFKE